MHHKKKYIKHASMQYIHTHTYLTTLLNKQTTEKSAYTLCAIQFDDHKKKFNGICFGLPTSFFFCLFIYSLISNFHNGIKSENKKKWTHRQLKSVHLIKRVRKINRMMFDVCKATTSKFLNIVNLLQLSSKSEQNVAEYHEVRNRVRVDEQKFVGFIYNSNITMNRCSW